MRIDHPNWYSQGFKILEDKAIKEMESMNEDREEPSLLIGTKKYVARDIEDLESRIGEYQKATDEMASKMRNYKEALDIGTKRFQIECQNNKGLSDALAESKLKLGYSEQLFDRLLDKVIKRGNPGDDEDSAWS